jgi:hypothetical protein
MITRKDLSTGDTVKYRYFLNHYGSRDMIVIKGIFIKCTVKNNGYDGFDIFYNIKTKESHNFVFYEALMSSDILLTEKYIFYE